jgi:mannose-6-phosphate isomerase-like protein (cupin superfamily)
MFQKHVKESFKEAMSLKDETGECCYDLPAEELPKGVVFGVDHLSAGYNPAKEHTHDDEYEIFYYTRGEESEYYINGKKLIVKEGDFIVIKPGEKHHPGKVIDPQGIQRLRIKIKANR